MARPMRLPALLLLALLVAPPALAQADGDGDGPPTCESQVTAALGQVAGARADLDRLRGDTLRAIVGSPPVNLTTEEQRGTMRILEGMGGQMAGLVAPADLADLEACGVACPPTPAPAAALLTARGGALAADAAAFVEGDSAASAQATHRRVAHGLQDLHGLAHAWLDERVAALRACSGQAPQEGLLACLAPAVADRRDPASCLAAAEAAWRRGPGGRVANRTAAERLGHVEADGAQATGVATAWQMRPDPVAAVQHLQARGVLVLGAVSGVGPATVRGDGGDRTLAGDRTEVKVQDGSFLRLDARCDLVCHLTFGPGVRLDATGPGRWEWSAGPVRGGVEATGTARANGTWLEVAAGRVAFWSLGPSLIAPVPEAWLASPRLLGVAVGVPTAQEAGSFGPRAGAVRLRPHAGEDGFTLELDLARPGCGGAVADARLFDAGALGQITADQVAVRLDRGAGTDELPASDVATLLAGGAGWALDGTGARVHVLACADAAGSYRLVANTASGHGSPGAGILVGLALLATAALCRRPKWRAA
ncbi:MAG: hypothetical protein QOD77_974 [Thermoplasmata archaeon]|jgi:hypothetical protein|nr:hypothetical protein [Thermoplasmata archaeon]